MIYRMLCGLLVGLAVTWASAAREVHAGPTLYLPLGIVGTDVGFEGPLPNFLGGDLYLRVGDENVRLVGTYEEDFMPIVIGDQLVGANGISTFTFQLCGITLGTITTSNESAVTGFDPLTGALFVESTGVVIDATGIFNDVEGGLMSCSSVILAPDFFALDADLVLTLTK